jgi:hypothetical protein
MSISGEPYIVTKMTIVDRLEANGLIAAAEAQLAAITPYLRQKWLARNLIHSDAQDMWEFLISIGADPDVILAPDPRIAAGPTTPAPND